MDRFVVKKRKHSSTSDELKNGASNNETDKLSKGDTGQNKKLKPEKVDTQIPWHKITGVNLNVDYCKSFLAHKEGTELMAKLEDGIIWNTGKTAQVQIFGKWHNIPRKQAAYGDAGLAYTFSGNTVPARSWIPLLADIRDRITVATGQRFNFVLINRYKDGNDHMGEHRDDEKDLVAESPIASLSLGQPRDFIFKHTDARGKKAKRKIDTVKQELHHGSLLMMNYPTNKYWYHSLPVRKNVHRVRINLTFRDFVIKK